VRAVAAALTACTAAALWPAPAGAVGDGGASGGGDTIISWARDLTSGSGGGRSSGGSGTGATGPVCRWEALSDEAILFLLHVAADTDVAEIQAFVEAIRPYLAQVIDAPVPVEAPTTTLPGPVPADTTPADPAARATTVPVDSVPLPGAPGAAVAVPGAPAPAPEPPPPPPPPPLMLTTIVVRVCDGVPDPQSIRSQTRPIDLDDAGDLAALTRTMVNLGRGSQQSTLEPLVLETQPPVSAAAVIGEPVFMRARPPAPLDATLRVRSVTVQVAARPTGLRLWAGQTGLHDEVRCPGLGRRYDPAGAPPRTQARSEGACTLTYELPTPAGHGWGGYARLDWSGTWSASSGAGGDLDGLFTFAPFERAVVEADTVIGSG
jgi:hypothetical protein